MFLLNMSFQINQKAAESLADPQEYPNLFPDWQWALDAEERVKELRGKFPSSKEYSNYAHSTRANLIEELKADSQGNGAIANGHAEHEDGEYYEEEEYEQDVAADAGAEDQYVEADGEFVETGANGEEEVEGAVEQEAVAQEEWGVDPEE
jgi:coatomer subunit beta'